MIRAAINPLTLLLAVSCLQWLSLAEVGPFTLLVPYAGLAVITVYAALSPRRLAAAMLYIRRNASWVAPLAIYLAMMTAMLSGSAARSVSPRQIFYLLGGVATAASIATARRITTSFRVGAAMGLIVLVVFIEFLARRIGLSWTDALRQFFGRGDLKYVIYDFFTAIFNSVDPDDVFSASTKNEVANSLLVLALLFRSASIKPHRDFLGMGFMGVSLALLVMLNDRSVLIAAAANLFIATAVGAMTRPIKNVPVLVIKFAALFAAAVVGIASMTASAGIFSTLSDRFSFTDNSTAARLSQYHGAIPMIESHPFAGNGFFTVDGFAIHDAFLNAWAYGGLVAFALVVIFYLTVLRRWIIFVVTAVRESEWWVLPLALEWVAALPFMPLFRMWISGEGGILKFGEWIALSAFFGCLLANELRLRATSVNVPEEWPFEGQPREPMHSTSSYSGRLATPAE